MKLVSLKVIKESGKRKLFLIPYFFTFANAFFGFVSVLQALEGNIRLAAYLIGLAVLMDVLDGRLARAFKSSSALGMELDSLSDAISFCFAPAVLLYSWKLSDTGLLGIGILAAYLCAGLLRLAKFNVISNQKETEDFFIGLPTTSAALFLIHFVLYEQWMVNHFLQPLVTPAGLLVLVALLAFLMISPIRFPAFKRTYLSSRVFFFMLAGGGIISIFLLTQKIPVFFLALCAYIFGSILYAILSFARSLKN